MTAKANNDRTALIRQMEELASQFKRHAHEEIKHSTDFDDETLFEDDVGYLESLENDKELTENELDAHLAFHGLTWKDVESLGHEAFGRVGIDPGWGPIWDTIRLDVRDGMATAVRIGADSFEKVREFLTWQPPALSAEMRSGPTSGSLNEAKTPQTSMIDELVYRGVRVLPVEWSPWETGAGKSKLTLQFLKDWPSELKDPKVSIDGLPANFDPPIKMQKAGLIYLILNLEVTAADHFLVTLKEGVPIVEIKTKRTAN